MAEPMLDEKVLALSRALDAGRVPHAFGGAIALAYWATPRGTEDIDVNVFIPIERAARVRDALAPLGVAWSEQGFEAGGHARTLQWGHTPIHVFFAYDPFHARCAERARTVPFADDEIPVLAAEDIAIFKLLYDRPKDRVEVREILLCMGERLDLHHLRHWLERFVGAGDERLELLDEAMS